MRLSKYKSVNITIKILLGFLAFILLGFLLVKLAFLTPYVQNQLRVSIVSQLDEQFDCEVSIESFHLSFLKEIQAQKICFSKDADTLIYLDKLSVNIRIIPLFHKQIVAKEIKLSDGFGAIDRLIALSISDTTNSEKTEEVADKDADGWEFSVEKIVIHQCNYSYRDEKDVGFELVLNLGDVELYTGGFDLDFDSLIYCQRINVKETFVIYESLEPTSSFEEDTTAFSFANILVGEAHLNGASFSYIDFVGKIIFNAKGHDLDVNDLLIDITREKIAISNGEVNELLTEILFLPELLDTLPETDDYLNWGQYLYRVEGDDLKISDYQLRIDYLETPNPYGHFNNEHLHFKEVNGVLKDFVLDKDTLLLSMENLSGKEGNGFEIKNANARFSQNDSLFLIENMELQTSNTYYQLDLITNMSPTNYIDINDKTLNLNLNITDGNFSEIDYFYPFLKNTEILSSNFKDVPYQLSLGLSGKMNHFNIHQLQFNLSNSSTMLANAEIKLPTADQPLFLDLNLDTLLTTKSDLENTIALNKQEFAFSFPQLMALNGRVLMENNFYEFSGDFNSDVGEINFNSVKLGVNDLTEIGFDVNAHLKELYRISDFGVSSADFNTSGSFRGKDLYTSNAELFLQIDSLNYDNYHYKNIHLMSSLEDGQLLTKLKSADSSFNFSIDAQAWLNEEEQEILVDLDAQKIDLYGIHQFDEALSLNTKMNIALDFKSEDEFSLQSQVEKLQFCFADTNYRMHTIEITGNTRPNESRLKLQSYFYNLDFESEEPFSDLILSLEHKIFSYFKPQKDSIIKNPAAFSLNGHLKYPEAFARVFFPDIPQFENLNIIGEYQPESDRLQLDMGIDGLKYNDIYADKIQLDLFTEEEDFEYVLKSGLKIEEWIDYDLQLSGKANYEGIYSQFECKDDSGKNMIKLNTHTTFSDSIYLLSLLPENTVLNYNNWIVSDSNQIFFTPSSIRFKNFSLHHNSEKIEIKSTSQPNGIQFLLDDFSLDAFGKLLQKDSVICGRVHLDFESKDIFRLDDFTTTLSVDSLSLMNYFLGKYHLNAFQKPKEKMNLEMALTGPNLDLEAQGNIDLKNTQIPIDLKFDLKQFNLESLNSFLPSSFSEATGMLKAQFYVSKNIEKPRIDGYLRFSDASLKINALNEKLSIGNTQIDIKNNNLSFNRFLLTNENNENAYISGTVALHSDSNYYSDLRINTDMMELMNSTIKENDLVFGYLKSKADISIVGYPENRNVDIKIQTDKSTELTYIFPDELKIHKSDGLVRYSKYNNDTIHRIQNQNIQKEIDLFAIQNLNANVSIDRGVNFKLFFDEKGSNFLDASLHGQINYEILEDISETSGSIELDAGNLKYGIPMIPVDEFKLEKGSRITLSNDLYNPVLDLIASASVRASTEGLMTDYNKVMTFKVLLKMSGELNNLKLKFDIDTQTSDPIVSSKLATLSEVERNMNAINLLARGAFVVSLSGTEAGGTSMADAQIDKFYANQLNSLISDNIHFVDLDFDVQSYNDYNSSGDKVFRRNYYYNIGKSFLNDRAKIKYKGSMNFINDMETEEINSSFVQNELNMEFNITEDGRLVAVFFRKNQYEGILEGEIIETGGGLRFSQSFYSIRDIFINYDKANKKKKEENE